MIEWNKNSSSVCEIKGKRVISKNYEKPIFLRRELFFYDLFQKNPLIRTPKIYSSDRINLKTHFIESEEKDVFKTAEEWAKVHSYFMKHPQKMLFHRSQIRPKPNTIRLAHLLVNLLNRFPSFHNRNSRASLNLTL